MTKRTTRTWRDGEARPTRATAWLGLVLLALLATACGPAGGDLAGPQLRTQFAALEPGQSVEIRQDVHVNIVFVGFEPGAGPRDIDEAALLAELPASYRPQVRFKRFYGLPSDMGLQHDYHYTTHYTDAAFEDAFFGHLASIAEAKPLTLFQQLYNGQATRALDVVDNHWIDAPSVEQWLADHLGGAGVDTSRYTVVFVNWYGRSDFVHHVYTKTDEPDPDTGYDFGTLRQTRKISGWGGTPPDDEESGLGGLHRLWFLDLSAGPEAWSDNWFVDVADLDGDGVDDRRMPPVWEYGTPGALPLGSLSEDLGLITRYVAIDLLFTTSPLYSPAISGPLLPEHLQLDINVFQADPGADGRDWFDVPLIAAEVAELQPQNQFSVELTEQGFDGRVERMYGCFAAGSSCFGQRLFGIAFADPFLYFQDHALQLLEGDADYEIPIIAWNTTDALFTCCLGYADDDWATGTQSFVFAFDAPFIRDAGYGFTTTTIHEVGHHVGLSHPHDGYDWESDTDFGPGGPFYFAWLGDESNSMMSYIDLNWDFSQFDRDNMGRFMTATYLHHANAVAAKVLATPRAGRAAADLAAADAAAATALALYEMMDYVGAAESAEAAYHATLAAAAAANVKIEPQARPADVKAKGKSDKFVDVFDPNHKRFGP